MSFTHSVESQSVQPDAEVFAMRTITFSGYTWQVKESRQPVGPGPNLFSADVRNMEVDRAGRLHLRITRRGEVWQCAEVVNTRSLGYGTYRFTIETNVAPLDPNVVVGLFTWSNAPEYAHREIDIEFAQWGIPTAPNAQYVVQPFVPGRYHRFTIPPGTGPTVHSFLWLPNRVHFVSRKGRNPDRGTVLGEWTYAGEGIPRRGDENPRMNLWLMRGLPPQDGREVEVIVSRFQFLPP